MALTPRSLQKLQKRLPKGAVPQVMERLKAAGHEYTRPYLYMVLAGKRYNRAVVLEMIRYAEEHEAQVRSMNARAKGQAA